MAISQNIYQVDAFASKVFEGNQAAVCPLEAWLDDALMQRIGQENNLSETAFFVPSKRDGYDFDLRWFTPTEEVDLCGHATLASAFIIFTKLGFVRDVIRFHSVSGLLSVARDGELLTLDFPAWPLEKTDDHPAIAEALQVTPLEIYKSYDWVVVLDSAQAVQQLTPDFSAMKLLDARGLIVTAAADANSGFDFVSRAFFPKLGIEEDPVTGSAHCALTPYWAKRLGKKPSRLSKVARAKASSPANWQRMAASVFQAKRSFIWKGCVGFDVTAQSVDYFQTSSSQI